MKNGMTVVQYVNLIVVLICICVRIFASVLVCALMVLSVTMMAPVFLLMNVMQDFPGAFKDLKKKDLEFPVTKKGSKKSPKEGMKKGPVKGPKEGPKKGPVHLE